MGRSQLQGGSSHRRVGAPLRRLRVLALLFWTNWAIAAGLAALVWLAPLGVAGSGKLIDLFAQDVTVRRTALASAIGMAVTGWVFFRSSSPAGSGPGRLPRLPPNNVVGA